MHMKCIFAAMKDFFTREWSPAEKVMMILVCFLSGMVHGFLWAPIKKGISCGNNSGNTYVKGEENKDE